MTYYRYTTSMDNMISPYFGFGMFAESEDSSEGYGDLKFTYDGADGVDIEDLRDRIVSEWEAYRDIAPDYMQDFSSDEIFECFNPVDIVESAGAWDNEDFVRFFWDCVYDDERAIITNDGAIVFDKSLVVYRGNVRFDEDI